MCAAATDRNGGTNAICRANTRPRFAFASFAWLVASLALSALPMEVAPAQANDLRVMTYNTYEGTDFTQLAAAANLWQLLVAVGQTILQVRATNPPSRMQALAKQILAAGPTLVSLEELGQWYSAPLLSLPSLDQGRATWFAPATSACGSMSLEFDMLQELLNALGPSYRLVYQAPQYEMPAVPGYIPSTGTVICVKDQDYIAILARTDLPSSQFQLSNVQWAQFTSEASFKTAVGSFPEPRAWISVDGSWYGEAFRFIGTHLETDDANIRQMQGGELRAGPANTSLPVIIAMDSNAQAAPPPQDPTYTDFIAAGYSDVWADLLPQTPGFTCCQGDYVNNRLSQLSRRIDLILTTGNLEAARIALFGATAKSKTPAGLWPSDHAGVAAEIGIAAP
jgi:endonuclease/exonuclease/phosphatase family metal-dependent hydrolase